jgi:protein-L-isoaspartate(D-aspartate) O-methyltransferase
MDQPKFIKPRQALVEYLRQRGIQDDRVLSAISAVPRHAFIQTGLHHRAYEDTALPIAKDQTISQPYTVARQSELLGVGTGDKVLEIGTGSGYQAAVLVEMGVSLHTIERHEELHQQARELLHQLGYRAKQKCGDGTLGWSAFAPYDAIIVTAGAPVVPASLKEQLSTGGRLVIPVGEQGQQLLRRLTKQQDGSFREESFSDVAFVPLIGDQGWG